MSDPLLGIMERARHSRAKDERIAALETENAILHIKVAQLQGYVRELLSGEWAASTAGMDTSSHGDSCRQVCQLCENRHNKILEMEQQVELLRRSLCELREQVMASSGQVENSLRTVQTIIPAVLQRTASRTAETNELKLRYEREKSRRRELHNVLMELRGNIRVHCRIRPILHFDRATHGGQSSRPNLQLFICFLPHRARECIGNVDEEVVSVQQVRDSVSGPNLTEKRYEFDKVYGPAHSQKEVFSDVQPLLTSLLDGYNVCIMAYGQTGSGKTHTMLGEGGGLTLQRQHGVIPKAAEELFRLLREKEVGEGARFEVRVSISEVYNEQVRDLIAEEKGQRLGIVSSSEGGVEVSNLSTKRVSSSSELMSLVQEGMRTRASDSTHIHEHSSRSHLIVTVYVTGEGGGNGDRGSTAGGSAISLLSSLSTPGSSRDSTPMGSPPGSPLRPRSSSPSLLPRPLSTSSLSHSTIHHPLTTSHTLPPYRKSYSLQTKLQLVDLAGRMTGVTGSALREAQHINKSLSAISDVLGALSERRQHVPYRNSTLTYLLQDSIGGDAKLLMFVCVSPTEQYVSESVRVMGFGSRARQVQRGPPKRHKTQATNQHQ